MNVNPLSKTITAILIAGAAGVAPSSTWADIIVVAGSDGSNGTHGIAGNPGTQGGNGTAGENATALANGPTLDNTATATGGAGGAGGNGGDGTPAGASGGDGGSGAKGGDAQAIAVTNLSHSLNATASASASAGSGGIGGAGATFGLAGLPGDGGDASATASSRNAGSGGSTADAVSHGGNGAGAGAMKPSSGANGGHANSSATATGIGLTIAQSTARGGNGGQGYGYGGQKGGNGATATATASGSSSGGGDVQVYAYQIGGSGGFGDESYREGNYASGGNGADSIMHNAVTGSTSGVLTLGQYATGGNGGGASGHGSSNGASGLAGIAISILEANTAESSSLNTRTSAIGGVGGSFDHAYRYDRGSDGGDAVAINTTNSNGDGHNINAKSYAEGGDGGNTDGSGMTGGNATSKTMGTASGNSYVQVTDKATGGKGGHGANWGEGFFSRGDGGSASSIAIGSNAGNQSVEITSTTIGGTGGGGGGLASASASGSSSGGGNVTVNAYQYGGHSEIGNGADSSMNNVVTGSTSGVLTLGQYAYGGDSSSISAAYLGNGGAALSTLSVYNSDSKVLNTVTHASGGTGRFDGGNANAENTTYSYGNGRTIQVISSEAVGGDGGFNFLLGAGKGGDAISHSNGGSSGNGYYVQINDKATGGNGGNSVESFISFLDGGNGGAAVSNASAAVNATGSQRIFVSSTANGGQGGNTQAINGHAGNGGLASAATDANNLGNQSVYATSEATGGAGGESRNGSYQGLAGDAQAHTKATSQGYASGIATATAGTGSALASLITADASAAGGNGAYAKALASQSSYASVLAETRVSSGVSGTSEAKAALGQPVAAPATDKQALAYATALPLSADVTASLESHANVNHDFKILGGTQAWLLGNQGVLNTALDGNFHDYSSKIDLNINTSAYDSQQNLLLGLLSPVFGAADLGVNDTLSFDIVISGAGGTLSKNYSFSHLLDLNTPDSAANFFHDKTLDLGNWSGLVSSADANLDIALILNLHSHVANTGMSVNYLLGTSPVPLPAALWLFGSVLLGWTCFGHRQSKRLSK